MSITLQLEKRKEGMGLDAQRLKDMLRLSMALIIHPFMTPHFIYRITKTFVTLFLNEAPLAL